MKADATTVHKKDDNCPLPRRRASPYVVAYVVMTKAVRRSRADGNLTSPARADDKEWNEMEQNGTELKVSPLLGTPDEATVATLRATLAQCVGVSGVPNEARVASFSASTVGVNQAKLGQMRPFIENFASRPPANPFSRWEKARMRVRGIGK